MAGQGKDWKQPLVPAKPVTVPAPPSGDVGPSAAQLPVNPQCDAMGPFRVPKAAA